MLKSNDLDQVVKRGGQCISEDKKALSMFLQLYNFVIAKKKLQNYYFLSDDHRHVFVT